MNAKRLRVIGVIALLIGATVSPVRALESKPRIAVLEFDRVQTDEAEAAAAADKLRDDLVNLRAFTVLDRAQTGAVLDELAFQSEGITDQSRAVALGKLLNVEYIVSGRITRLETAYQVNARMIEVETAEIVRSESIIHEGDILGLLAVKMPRLAGRLASLEQEPVPPPPESATMPPSRAAEDPLPTQWPAMGMMQGMGREGLLMAGGMMLMGAAMVASRMGDDNTGAALAMGAVGIGIIMYYLISWDGVSSSSSGLVHPGSTRVFPGVAIDAESFVVFAAVRW